MNDLAMNPFCSGKLISPPKGLGFLHKKGPVRRTGGSLQDTRELGLHLQSRKIC